MGAAVSLTFSVFAPSIVIHAQNKGLRVVYGGTPTTINLDEGTYYLGGSGSSLLGAIDTKLEAIAAGWTNSVSRDITSGSSGMTVTITSPASNWYIDVTHAATTFDMTTIGMSQTVNASAALSQTSTATVGGNWVAGEARSSDDGGFTGNAIVIKLADGSSATYSTGAITQNLNIDVKLLERYRIWTDTARATIHPALKRLISGDQFEYHETTISSGSTLTALSSSTLVGTTWKLADPSNGLQFDRVDISTQLWSTSFDIVSEGAQ